MSERILSTRGENVFRREFALTTIKVGSYHQVELVAEEFGPKFNIDPSNQGLIMGSIGILKIEKLPSISNIAKAVISQGAVPLPEIQKVSLGSTNEEVIFQAGLLSAIEGQYQKVEQDLLKLYGEKLPDQLGFVLSDFMEVIPPQISAKILRSSWLGKHLKSKSRKYFPQDKLVESWQKLSTEAFVLMPSSARLEIFQNMDNHDRHLLLKNFSLGGFIYNFGNLSDPNSGICLIFQNLEGEQGLEKADEVREDFVPMMQILRN